MSSQAPFLFPQVTRTPGSTPAQKERLEKKQGPGEFDRMMESVLKRPMPQPELAQVQEPLKFSNHATQRLRERSIAVDPEMMSKLRGAVDKAEAKGLDDALVLTDKGAFIVNVGNKTVVTALDQGSVSGSVFTNIDGAVVV